MSGSDDYYDYFACRYKLKAQKHASAAASSKVEITWPHLAELARQSSIISRNVQSDEMDKNIQNNDFPDGTVSRSTSFTIDPAYAQTIISQQSFNSKVLRHYQYETASDSESLRTYKSASNTTSRRPYIPPYATDSVQSSPRAVKRPTAHSNSPRTKKKRSDGTETSNSWEAEKIEDSVAYKARARKLWKQAQESPMKFQAVL